GWGLQVLSREPFTARLLVAAADGDALEHLADGGRLAVTAAVVATNRSRQLKGTVAALEPATAADRARAGAYADAFFADVEASDGTPRPLLERLLPAGYVAATVTFDELYDQTPGPTAGTPLAGTSR
ncbi:MAG TPA: hypothetical protein VM262_05555, partial [Acidimicrobiales bacterium]|nr:hypothetical protein [Acidimicrobiales bacterium]